MVSNFAFRNYSMRFCLDGCTMNLQMRCSRELSSQVFLSNRSCGLGMQNRTELRTQSTQVSLSTRRKLRSLECTCLPRQSVRNTQDTLQRVVLEGVRDNPRHTVAAVIFLVVIILLASLSVVALNVEQTSRVGFAMRASPKMS